MNLWVPVEQMQNEKLNFAQSFYKLKTVKNKKLLVLFPFLCLSKLSPPVLHSSFYFLNKAY